jgi:hypothetical protein
MAPRNDSAGMSDLELEVELDMEAGAPDEEGWAGETDEAWQGELETDEEGPEEEVDEEGYDDEGGAAYGAADPRDRALAERFYELSGQSFESEADLDRELNEILGEAERDYFLGKAWRRIKKSGALRGLASKVAGRFPQLKAITQLARGNLRGALRSAAGAALAAAVPGGPLLVKGLGFEAAGEPDASRAAWQNYAQLAREAYETMADRLHEGVDQPLAASRLAASAFQDALQRAQVRGAALARGAVGAAGGPRRMRRVVWLEPGQVLVVKTRPR